MLFPRGLCALCAPLSTSRAGCTKAKLVAITATILTAAALLVGPNHHGLQALFPSSSSLRSFTLSQKATSKSVPELPKAPGKIAWSWKPAAKKPTGTRMQAQGSGTHSSSKRQKLRSSRAPFPHDLVPRSSRSEVKRHFDDIRSGNAPATYPTVLLARLHV